jgi:hypothetical protein
MFLAYDNLESQYNKNNMKIIFAVCVHTFNILMIFLPITFTVKGCFRKKQVY